MTIKELCDKSGRCINCSFNLVCPYCDYWDITLNRLTDDDNDEITRAIIETAKILQKGDKSKVEKEIREGLNRLTTYRLPNSNTDLVTLKSVQRVLNLIFRGSRESEVE